MPLIQSSYRPGRWLRGEHLETIIPAQTRPLPRVRYHRERIETPDEDFLDLDWSYASGADRSERLVILSHGLEGSSDGKYIRGTARVFNAAGWDALAWNCRGCSGEINRLPRTYHSGISDDLGLVIDRVLGDKTLRMYRTIVLVGYSMGGNITLKYLGEKGAKVSKRIKRGVAFSVPCSLHGCSIALARPANRIYMMNFLISLRRKIRDKRRQFPDLFQVSDRELRRIKTFREFDDRFTAPLHGFQDAADYWERASSNPFLAKIRVPTLLVQARNDPFLNEDCFPEEIARGSKHLFLEVPDHGGHVGFSAYPENGDYWSERRALAWAESR